jgi:hypothetical protein
MHSQLWDLETRACTATFQGHREAVTAVDIRPGCVQHSTTQQDGLSTLISARFRKHTY